MSTWNYRVIEHPSHLGLHEVHYGDDGRPTGWTAEPIIATDIENGVADLVSSLRMMLDDAVSRPVLNVADLGQAEHDD